jgi:hypothetical protein
MVVLPRTLDVTLHYECIFREHNCICLTLVALFGSILLLSLESRKLEFGRLSPFQSLPVAYIPRLIPS